MKKIDMMNLSEDARYIINFLTQSSDATWRKFTSDTGKFIKEKLHQYLHTECEWSWTRIWSVMAELHIHANEMK